MTCPGGAGHHVEKVTGAIAEPMIACIELRDRPSLTRRVRPATFYVCMTCEWCSETAPRKATNGR